MPLRDHFRPPLDKKTSWEGFYGSWPTLIVMGLNRLLPPRYLAEPRVHLGDSMEIDVTAFDEEMKVPLASGSGADEGAVAADLPDQYAYEVLVFDTWRDRRLVAAVEIVSPANKNRPENRRAFVTKCAALLQQRVSVAIVDLVTTRRFNLYGDLLEVIGQADPALVPEPPPLYAAASRCARREGAWYFESWTHPLALGQPLPTLPLWLADDFALPLELETTYEETCRIFRLA